LQSSQLPALLLLLLVLLLPVLCWPCTAVQLQPVSQQHAATVAINKLMRSTTA
jgi:hypothetical protein